MPSTLIIGNYRHTLSVIRSLSRAGQHVILGFHGDAETCNHSRYVDETWEHPDPENEQASFIVSLKQLASCRPELETIIPIGEKDIRLLLEIRAFLPPNLIPLMCNESVVEACLHKPTLSAIVDELQIPQCPYAVATSKNELITAANAIGYPCIVKLVDSEFLINGRKAIICDNADAILENFSSWPVTGKAMIIQRYIDGDRHNLYFYAQSGQIIALCQTQALRTDRLDGTGLSVSGRTVEPNPALVEYCAKLVARLDYSGAGCMQFLIDKKTTLPSFLEHNPRIGAGFALAYRTGLDLPRLMLEYARTDGQAFDVAKYPCRVGARYAWTTGDLAGLRRAIMNRELDFAAALQWFGAIIVSFITSSIHITWDWRDPLPTIVRLFRMTGSETGLRRSR